MFGFFGNKSVKPSALPESKIWIEKNFEWFIKIFGLDILRNKPFFLLNRDDFPYDNLKDSDQFSELFLQLCNYLEIDANDIAFQFFDDFKSREWSTYIPFDRYRFSRSIFSQSYDVNEKRFQIKIAQSAFQSDAVIISILIKELMRVKFVSAKLSENDAENFYAILELACVYHGMGMILANVVLTSDKKWLSAITHLTDKEISYANALVCYLAGIDGKQYLSLLNANTKSLFKQNFEYLFSTNDTYLSERAVNRAHVFWKSTVAIKTGFRQNDFKMVIDACNVLFKEQNNKTTYVYTNWGYALLKQKKYSEAMAYFDKAIDVNPFGAFPYNNRGYCKLNTGDLNGALIDIQSSLDLDAENGFAWRNLGVYYLAIGDVDTALEYFKTAINKNPKTELIHFYLSKAFDALDMDDLSQKHKRLSLDKGEYNDSVYSDLVE